MPTTDDEEKYREMERRQEARASKFWDAVFNVGGFIVVVILVTAAIILMMR